MDPTPAPESGRLIKARVARNHASATAFNFEDLRRQCDEYIEEARRQGQTILAEAAGAADEVRRRAHAEGIQAGQREGLAAVQHLIDGRAAEIADRQTQQQLQTVLPAFQSAVQALQAERDGWLAAWEKAAVTLSAAIAERIVRHELARQPALGRSVIREALELAAGQPHVELHLHPDDLALFQQCGEEVTGTFAPAGKATFVPDASVSRGGCLIETQHGVIDARLETQLARITQELLEDGSAS
jgi:flagellar assembly protein FliH